MTTALTDDDDPAKCPAIHFVVMGPSGCGKSTIGKALAESLHVPFVDGDVLHPPGNLAKMASGQPLIDADRWPWLDRVAARLGKEPTVIACSALARKYRTYILKACPQARFIELRVPTPELQRRMSTRKHFMPPALLDSQLSAWEHLQNDEPGVSIDNTGDTQHVAASIQHLLHTCSTR